MTLLRFSSRPLSHQPILRAGAALATLLLLTLWVEQRLGQPYLLSLGPVVLIGLLLSPRAVLLTLAGPILLLAGLNPTRAYHAAGFLLGWLLAGSFMAWLLASIRDGSFTNWEALWRSAVAAACGTAIIWLCGWAWLAFGAPNFGAERAFMLGVLPSMITALPLLATAVFTAALLQPLLQAAYTTRSGRP